VPRGSAYALSTILRYVILLSGFLVAMSALGFDTDRLTVLLGAFGVGLGFGLQTVVNNFVSGLILIFERPVKVGDTVEPGQVIAEIETDKATMEVEAVDEGVIAEILVAEGTQGVKVIPFADPPRFLFYFRSLYGHSSSGADKMF